MHKILAIVGARPQFIKHAPLLKNACDLKNIHIVSLHTGQHYDENMSGIFFNELAIPKPEYQLNIGSGNHGEQTGKMMTAIEKVVMEDDIQGIIVYGDTNSTLAGALVGAKLHIPVFHIEAGLRSFDKRMPEEINRILTDQVSEILFIPTENARVNLVNEGIPAEKVISVGDLMFEAHTFFGNNLTLDSVARDKDFALATIHRAENTNSRERMEGITKLLLNIAQKLEVVLPLHPRTKKYLSNYGLLEKWSESFTLIDPIGYIDMLKYEKAAKLIVTDSGGVQKEAFFSETPCLTLRDSTEWIELVECGANRLVNPQNNWSVDVQEVLDTPVDYSLRLYGEPNSSDTILKHVQNFYN
jgi:UDP-GlcNAc3NAcA epimerase